MTATSAAPANLSAPVAPLTPNVLASSRWSALSTFAQKCPARAIRGQVADSRLGQNSTSGGSSDTAANDWQANPAGPSSSAVVMTVTPVPKWPSTCRNRRGSGSNRAGEASGAAVIRARPGRRTGAPTG